MFQNGRIPLWYAASEGHTQVLYYLLRERHDSYNLLDDRRVSNRSIGSLIQKLIKQFTAKY